MNARLIAISLGLSIVAACTGNPQANQHAAACLAAVAPVVIAEATAKGTSDAQKGINSGLAVVSNPDCVTAAGAAVAAGQAAVAPAK